MKVITRKKDGTVIHSFENVKAIDTNKKILYVSDGLTDVRIDMKEIFNLEITAE